MLVNYRQNQMFKKMPPESPSAKWRIIGGILGILVSIGFFYGGVFFLMALGIAQGSGGTGGHGPSHDLETIGFVVLVAAGFVFLTSVVFFFQGIILAVRNTGCKTNDPVDKLIDELTSNLPSARK